MSGLGFVPVEYVLAGYGTRKVDDLAVYLRPSDGGDFDALTIAEMSLFDAAGTAPRLAVTIDSNGDGNYADPAAVRDPSVVWVRAVTPALPGAEDSTPAPPVFIARRGSRVGLHVNGGETIPTNRATVGITFWRKVTVP